MIVCTLCSCYPWEVLGLPPVWYKSAPYRSRAVIDPRGVLADFGVSLPNDTEIRVWDSTAETRFIVLPMRPAGTEGWSEERSSPSWSRAIRMIGTGARQTGPTRPRDGRHSRHGRHARLRPGRARAERAAVSRRLGRAACWRCSAPWAMPARGTSTCRAPRRRGCRRMSISPRPITSDGRWRGGACARARLRRHRGARGRPCAAARQAVAAQAHGRRRRGGADARLVLPPGAGAGAVQGRRPGAHQQHPSGDPYAAAALCARTRSA